MKDKTLEYMYMYMELEPNKPCIHFKFSAYHTMSYGSGFIHPVNPPCGSQQIFHSYPLIT